MVKIKFLLLLTFVVNTIGWKLYNNYHDTFLFERQLIANSDGPFGLISQLRDLFLHHEKRNWQDFVVNQLIRSALLHAAMIDLDGTLLAISPHFAVQPDEASKLSMMVQNPASAIQNHIVVNSVNYWTTKADGRSIYGTDGNESIIFAKSIEAIVIGIYNNHLQTKDAASMVEGFADYLTKNGY